MGLESGPYYRAAQGHISADVSFVDLGISISAPGRIDGFPLAHGLPSL